MKNIANFKLFHSQKRFYWPENWDLNCSESFYPFWASPCYLAKYDRKSTGHLLWILLHKYHLLVHTFSILVKLKKEKALMKKTESSVDTKVI